MHRRRSRTPTGKRLLKPLILIGLAALMVASSCSNRESASPSTSNAPSTITTASAPPTESITAYFDAPSPSTLTAAIASLPPVEPGDDRLGDLLRETSRGLEAGTGRTSLAAPIGFNQHRQITLRTPAGYDPQEAWPLIVAYHSWGGTADRMLDRLEELLGPEIEQFVVAAPDQYRQTVLDAPPPVSAEHISVWREIMTRRHIDPDRIYLVGYSLGGDTVMTMSALHGHRVAAGVAWAASPAFPPDVEGMFGWFAPGLADTPLLHVWGSEDDLNIPGLNFRRSPHRLAELNSDLGPVAATAGLDLYTAIEVVGANHNTVRPPLDLTLQHLAQRRGAPPTVIHQVFRYIHQADTAWIEGHEWHGEGWFTTWPSPDIEAGTASLSEEADVIRALLGSIDAVAGDNTIEVTTSHLADFTVWLPEGLVNFDTPVVIVWNGTTVFAGSIEPDPGVALVQAERTRDFSRLRWAGIRITDGVAHVVTSDDSFPAVARGVLIG